MGRLTTHVLDIAIGRPAAGLRVELFGPDGQRLADVLTNADGRSDAPLLPESVFRPGSYELLFHAGDYLDRVAPGPGPRFLDCIPIRFGLADDRHYHVPLLLSPYGYSTYRGS